MSHYVHYFDVRIARQFESHIRDFERAFEKWASSFPTDFMLRDELLCSDESTQSILDGIVFSDTDQIDN